MHMIQYTTIHLIIHMNEPQLLKPTFSASAECLGGSYVLHLMFCTASMLKICDSSNAPAWKVNSCLILSQVSLGITES